MDGIEATREALKICPSLKVIVLSMHSESKYYDSMIQLGVHGFLLKESNYGELKNAIKSVMDGIPFFSQDLLLNLLRAKKVSEQNNIQLKPPRKECASAYLQRDVDK